MNNKHWNYFTEKVGHTIFHPQYFIHKYLHKSHELIYDRAKNKDLIDIGCGRMQNKDKYLKVAKAYTGLDHPQISKLYKNEKYKPDIYHDLNKKIDLKHKYDIAVMNEVLEYLTDPIFSLKEINKILNKNSTLVLTVPFLYPIHDYPLDRARYTDTQLKHFLKESNFTKTEIYPNGSLFEVLALFANIYLLKFSQKFYNSRLITLKLFSLILILISLFISVINNIIAVIFSFLLPNENIFVINYLVISQKK